MDPNELKIKERENVNRDEVIVDLDRKAMTKVIKYAMMQSADSKQANALEIYLNTLSDRQFEEFADKLISENKNMLSEMMKRFAEENGVSDIHDESTGNYVKEMSESFKQQILQLRNRTNISDIIHISQKERVLLQNLWKDNVKNKDEIPSDIIFANTIPLHDFSLKYTDSQVSDTDGRITIFEDMTYDDPNLNIAGCISLNFFHDTAIIIPLFVTPGCTAIKTCDQFALITYNKNKQKELADRFKRFTTAQLSGLIFELLATWYGIQIALLHPALKDIYKKAVPQKQFDPQCKGKNKKKKKRITRIVKNLYIKDGDFEAIMDEHAQSLNISTKKEYKTLAWYVMGHWRHLPSGNQTFIEGYWKGPLRQVKKNLDENRKRKIEIKGEET